VLRVFHENNPTKQLEGCNGITSHATYLAMQAYQGSFSCAVDVPVCPSILYTDISTYDPVNDAYFLNADTTILACQTLIIPNGVPFCILGGRTLTNLGTIQIDVTGSCLSAGTINNAGTFLSYGTTNNTGNSIFRNTGFLQIFGVFQITDSTSSLFNTGSIQNNNFGFLTNGGNIYNTGSILNNNSGTFTNDGNIYNSQGGIITNNAFYNYISGDVYNPPIVGSLCGIGIFDGTSPITPTSDGCPP
jgi:hypothetical protein